MILSPSHPLRVISAVPPLSTLFARALSTSSAVYAGGARPPRAPLGPSRFAARPGGSTRRDDGERSYSARDDDERNVAGKRKMRYVDERRLLSERKASRTGYGMGQNASHGVERTSRRLADLPRRVDATPSPLSFAKPASAASSADSAPQPLSSMDLPPTLVNGLIDVLGHTATTGKSTPIQTLAWRDMISPASLSENSKGRGWVLGAETGSGKTLAYLLPVMHRLKATEGASPGAADENLNLQTVQPRAIVLSPTHELTRQSTTVAKTLSHTLKLRIKGLSSTRWGVVDATSGTDILLGTTGSVRKLLGLGRDGELWADESRERDDADDENMTQRRAEQGPKLRTEKVEWVVIDEADVLLGLDFAPETRAILSSLPSTTHIVLCTATLPPSLLSALSAPPLSARTITHLISPGMHRLPSGLKTKFIGDTGGNLSASVVTEVRKAFEEDNLGASDLEKGKSKAVVFCNSDSRVRQISRKFEEKGSGVLCWTSKGVEGGEGDAKGTRQRGKQGELSAFLSSSTNKVSPSDSETNTRVLVTTSLLSRGLDFSSDISTVVLVDPPRDALDLVHRAGRTARAGRKGRVVVFGMGGKGDVRGFNNKGRGLKGRVGEEVSRVIRQRK